MKLTNKQMINMHTTLIEIGNKVDIDPVLGVNIARNNYELFREGKSATSFVLLENSLF